MKKIYSFLIISVMIGVFGGCSIKNMHYSHNLSNSVSVISEEFDRYTSSEVKQNSTILMTSIVNVNNFKETSNFGRLYSDSLLTNLKRSGWNIVDYRGKELATQAKNGEFYLSRENLQQLPRKNYYFLVGTYSTYADKLVLNVRVINSKTGEVLIASNSMIVDKEIVNLASISHCKDLSCENNFKIRIIKDDCSVTEQCNKD